jgi:hypothetical protein
MAFCQPRIQRVLKRLVLMYGVGSMQLWLHENDQTMQHLPALRQAWSRQRAPLVGRHRGLG